MHCLLPALLAASLAAQAQHYPRDRGSRDSMPRDRPEARNEPKAAAPVNDPYAALERELPSLRADLKLTSNQVDAWSLFERDVRDVAEMDRTRRKQLMALRDAGENPPTASHMIATLAEQDRLRAEATADLKRHFDVLYAGLDEGQRRTIDKRIVLSQTDPLGR